MLPVSNHQLAYSPKFYQRFLGVDEIILFYSVIVKPLCSEYLFFGVLYVLFIDVESEAKNTYNQPFERDIEGEKCIKPRIPFSLSF